MIRSVTQIGFLAAALALTTGCDGLHAVRTAHADLAAVRQAVQERLGSSAIEVRFSNASTLAVGIVNNPIQLESPEAKRAKARELAKVAYDAYAQRDKLGGVRIDFLARGGFALVTVSAWEEHRFEPSALGGAPPARTPAS